MIGFIVGVIKAEGFTPSPYKPTKGHDIKKLRKQAEEFLQRNGCYNETGIVETGNNWAVARIRTLDGYPLPDKLHLKINEDDDVLSIEIDDNNSFYTRQYLQGKKQILQLLEEDADYIEMLKKKISREGVATIHSKGFNNNKTMSTRKMAALCDALREKKFTVININNANGEISLGLEREYTANNEFDQQTFFSSSPFEQDYSASNLFDPFDK